MTTNNNYNFPLYCSFSDLPDNFNQKTLGEQNRLRKEQETNSRMDFLCTVPIAATESATMSRLKERHGSKFLKNPYPYNQKTRVKNPFDRNKKHSCYTVTHNFSNNFTKIELDSPKNRYGKRNGRVKKRPISRSEKQKCMGGTIMTTSCPPARRYGPHNGRLKL